ncbi:hypothetical protein D9611_009674 [Ephemerocybe angulata]|uniref:Uncharacterized protein n=1 Tax=Ephemerocybe angulata TaxID=980116 RepID=A0A8H5C6U3_9AGAR|nr:hypothetical protein D9611_009674 [Tulosesus angulatus]
MFDLISHSFPHLLHSLLARIIVVVDEFASHSILPFPHLSPPPLIVKLSKLDDDDGLYSGRAHCGQRRAPTHHHRRMTTTANSTRPTRARSRARCAQVHFTVERRLKHRLEGTDIISASTLWPTTSSNTRLTSTVALPRDTLTWAVTVAPSRWRSLPTSSTSAEFRRQIHLRRTQLAHPATFIPRPSRHVSSTDPCNAGTSTLIHVITQWDTGERVYGVGAAGRPDYALAQRKRRLGRRQSVGACCALARSTAKLRFESKHAYPSLRTAVLASGRLGRPWRARDGSGAFFTHHGVRARARKGTARSEVRAPQATFVVVVRQVWVSGAHPTRRRHPSSAALNSLLSPALCLTVRELTVAGWPVLDSLARFSVYWKARLRGGAGVE